MSRAYQFGAVTLCAIAITLTQYAAAEFPSAADLANDRNTPGDVLTYGMGHDLQRYSPLDQINAENVARLRPVWVHSLADNRGQESQPIVANGVMYVTTHKATIAIDAATGRQKWKQEFEYPPNTPAIVCCGIVNRGAAIFDGKLYRTTLDNHVLALDLATGEEVWKSKAAEVADSFSMTVAPLVADGVVLTGISGGEYGIRGFIDGWDAQSGLHLWRRFTTALKGEPGGDTWPGDTAEKGAGPTWLTGSYDAELGLVYWGVGNGGPWNASFRKGDNLYIASVLALKPKTGELVWHFQWSPNDSYDYDGVNENVLVDLDIDGKVHKVLMHADRNGFFYVLDRTNGELLAANQFADEVNWATGIDPESGRPIYSEVHRKVMAGELQDVWPSAFGGKNWSPMSYSPNTGLSYFNALEFGMSYKLNEPQFKKGTFYFGVDLGQLKWLIRDDAPHSYLRAVDPLTGKSKWAVPLEFPNLGATMTTAGNLVFTGHQTGEFVAYHAENGEKLWSFQTGSGIIGMPVTWESNGKQYVSVLSGIGGVLRNFIPAFGAHLTELNNTLASVPEGGAVYTFALD